MNKPELESPTEAAYQQLGRQASAKVIIGGAISIATLFLWMFLQIWNTKFGSFISDEIIAAMFSISLVPSP